MALRQRSCFVSTTTSRLTFSSDYSDDNGNGDNHNEPPSDAYEDLSESDEDGNDAPQQSLDGTLSLPSPDDSGSDPTPDDDALTSKLKKH